MADEKLTLGEKRIRTEFNSGNDEVVQNTKEAYAHLYDRLEKDKSYRVPGDGPTKDTERLRLVALAQTALEESAMWAVKSLTFEEEG